MKCILPQAPLNFNDNSLSCWPVSPHRQAEQRKSFMAPPNSLWPRDVFYATHKAPRKCSFFVSPLGSSRCLPLPLEFRWGVWIASFMTASTKAGGKETGWERWKETGKRDFPASLMTHLNNFLVSLFRFLDSKFAAFFAFLCSSNCQKIIK